MVSKEEIGRVFFACGWVEANGDRRLEDRLGVFGDRVEKIAIGEGGYFFYTQPFYADIAENETCTLIKLGYAHDGAQLLSAQDILERGLVGPAGIQYDQISGSASLFLFYKRESRLLIYRNLLSTFEIKYWSKFGHLVASDNLRLMRLLIPEMGLNQAVIPQHFIYRTVYGRQTYLQGADRLLAGEELHWEDGKLLVDQVSDLQKLSAAVDQRAVSAESVDWFKGIMNQVTGIYLDGLEHRSATMLSGGVDSSLIQSAINNHLGGKGEFPSFSFSVDSPSFAYEVEYASQAAKDLGTKHEFVKVTEEDYRLNLVSAIQLLGQPLPDDVRPCFLALTGEIARGWEAVQTLFHGQIADGLHGVGSSLEVVQGDKYRSWPPGLLGLLGKVLKPISQSKSYGAAKASEILHTRRNLSSPHQFLNAVGLYTDWDSVQGSFSPAEISQAFTMKRVLGYHYLETDLLVEQLNVLDLVTDGIDPACVVNQFGLFHGKQFVFPYSDESVVRATFAFEPVGRYTHGHRVKPILKSALESELPGAAASQPKGWSGMGEETLFGWMRDGELSELVQDIERPGFMKQADFEKKIKQPDWFTWNLLTLDVFKKEVLGD